MTHTPAPWSVMHNDEWRALDGLQPSSVCHVGDWTIVTDVMSYDFHGEDKADALLIAAAPELLAALRLVVGLADNEAVESGDCRNPDNPFAIARAAIAKATT
jgi:hypothetical protein